MPFEGIKIHAEFVSSLRAERGNCLGLLRSARNDRRDIFNSLEKFSCQYQIVLSTWTEIFTVIANEVKQSQGLGLPHSASLHSQ
jgi:hypothetical protein